jgi:Coenzyme PQQ synthesis protein D (PqqD)
MQIKKNIAISDTGFVFDPGNGESFSVNPIGLEILKSLKDGKSDDEVKKIIVSKYQVDNDSVEKDFYDFTKMLETLKLTESESKKD